MYNLIIRRCLKLSLQQLKYIQAIYHDTRWKYLYITKFSQVLSGKLRRRRSTTDRCTVVVVSRSSFLQPPPPPSSPSSHTPSSFFYIISRQLARLPAHPGRVSAAEAEAARSMIVTYCISEPSVRPSLELVPVHLVYWVFVLNINKDRLKDGRMNAAQV